MKTDHHSAETQKTQTSAEHLQALQAEHLQALQEERKHLETLFADRINFYLVFAAGVLAFLFAEQHPQRLVKPALWTVTILSVLMIFALVRTLRLVLMVLDDLKPYGTPYTKLSAKMPWYLPNANYSLIALPIALTAFFAYALLVSYLTQAPGGPDSSLIF
jgi:hypothetical protein